MKFSDIVHAAKLLLQHKLRVTHRALAREFALDDAALQDLVDELVLADRVATVEDGRVLVWCGPAPQAARPEVAVTATAAAPPEGSAAGASLAPAGDRRQLTVMFCDLVGSTALSEQLDPEDLHQLVTAYQQAVLRVVQRYEGHIAQYLGDGILAYFGYPVAHEDDAVRAVRAGLDILADISRLDVQPPVQVRVGLHTGPVVIGAVGEGGRTEQLALGKTPNVAARVQGAAAPHTLTISGATHRLVQGLFDCHDLGAHALRGVAEPVVLHQVVQPAAHSSRFDVQLQQGLSPMQGRTRELDVLLQCWQLARGGQGQLVLLRGEAGIGKSRLVQALGQAAGDDGVLKLALRCSPFYVNSPFYPVVDLLARRLQMLDDAAAAAERPAANDAATDANRTDHSPTPAGPPPAAVAAPPALSPRLQRLQQLIGTAGPPDPRGLALLATLLSIPVPESLVDPVLSREARKALTQQLLADWLLQLATRQPVLVVFEDLHWADPSTLELLSLVQARVPQAALMLATTCRSDFVPPWPGAAHVLELVLSRLAAPEIAQLAASIVGQPVPTDVLELLVRKTDGVPLYVEELTKDLLESRLLRMQGGQLRLAGTLLSMAVPFSLQDSMTSRLDRLGPARRLAEVAAVLGREFSHEWIAAVYDGDPGTLAAGLQALCDADILLRQADDGRALYVFRHALLRDAAYQSLLIRRRQQTHARVAQLLETTWRDTAAQHPELVAHHYTEAGLVQLAIANWQRAGLQAVERSANQEAIRHFGTALDILRTQPEGPDRDRQELALLMGLGVPLTVTTSWAAPEVRQANERALALCQTLGESGQLFRALFGVWSNRQVQADYRAAQPLTDQLLALARQAQDDGLQLQAHRACGIHGVHTGQFREGLHHCDAGLALYDPVRHRAHVVQYWLDPGVGCLCYGAWAQACTGHPDQALRRAARAVDLARDGGHHFSLAYALHFMALMHQLRREPAGTRLQAQALLDLAQEQGFPVFQAWGTLLLGCALAEDGRAAEGSALIRQGQAATHSAGARVARSASLAVLAAVYQGAGETTAGLATVDEALAFVEQSDERYYEAELHRVRGELLLQRDGDAAAADAQDAFTRALVIARHQRARTWELRAATSLARLHQHQGEAARGRGMLAAVLGGYTEGLDTRDVRDARVLLDGLGTGVALATGR